MKKINTFKQKIQKVLKKIIKGEGLFLSLLFIIFLITFIPTLDIAFNWIDDGWDISVAQNLLGYLSKLNLKGVFDLVIEENIGRFRPIYWLSQGVIYFVAGDNSRFHYLLHAFLVGVVVLIIYKIISFFSKSAFSGFVAASLFMLVSLNTENWVRLGPAEIFLGVFILSSLYYIFRHKDIGKATFFLTLAFLCKETAIAIVPALTVYVVLNILRGKKESHLIKYLMVSYFLLATSLLITFSIRTGYSTFYEFKIEESIYRFKVYLNLLRLAFPIGIYFFYTFVVRNCCILVNKGLKSFSETDVLQTFFLVFFISFLAIQSPWIYVLERYTLPATIFGAIFLGFELSKIITLLTKKNKTIYLVFIVIFGAYYSNYVLVSMTKNYGFIMRNSHYTQSLQEMFGYVAMNVPENGKVFINFKKNDGTMEPVLGMNLHLKLFYDRQDLNVKTLEERGEDDRDYLVVSSPTLLGSSLFIQEKDMEMDKVLSKKAVIRKKDSFIVLSNTFNMLKQTGKKVVKYVLNKEKISADGIYATYYLDDYWNFYKAN